MSWEIGAILVGIASFLLSYRILKIKSIYKRIVYCVLLPLMLSSVLYWGAIIIEGYSGGISSQASSWALIAILPWSIIGVASLLAGMLLWSRDRKISINGG